MSKYLVKYDLETEKGQFTKEECVSDDTVVCIDGQLTKVQPLARSYEQCKEQASDFISLISWQKGHQASYKQALRKNWHRQIAEELGWKMKALDRAYEQCKEQAESFSSLRSWSKGHGSSYKQALKESWHRQIAEELGWKIQEKVTRSYEQCKEEAEKFSSLNSWQKGHQASYKQALRKNWHRQIAEELGWKMKAVKEVRTYGQCKEQAE